MDQVRAHTCSTIKDIIAVGFDVKRTFIFNNFHFIKHLYPAVCAVQRKVTVNQVGHTFMVKGDDAVCRVSFPAIQMVPSFSSTFPVVLSRSGSDHEPSPTSTKKRGNSKCRIRCLIPCGIDQDAYFRLTRDVAKSLGEHKPAVIHAKFLPSLHGVNTKMSSTTKRGAVGHKGKGKGKGKGTSVVSCMVHAPIMLNDTPKQIAKKIRRAVSGGQETIEMQRKFGADLTSDVSIQYLKLFMEDREQFAILCKDYEAGRVTTGRVKELTTQVLCSVVAKHQEARARVTDEIVNAFMTRRPIM